MEYVQPSSQWGRAGLIVRDVTNFGVNQALQTGSAATAPPYDGLAGRYQKVHVNPVTTAMGTPGNDAWEGNRRLDTGGASTTALTRTQRCPTCTRTPGAASSAWDRPSPSIGATTASTGPR